MSDSIVASSEKTMTKIKESRSSTIVSFSLAKHFSLSAYREYTLFIQSLNRTMHGLKNSASIPVSPVSHVWWASSINIAQGSFTIRYCWLSRVAGETRTDSFLFLDLLNTGKWTVIARSPAPVSRDWIGCLSRPVIREQYSAGLQHRRWNDIRDVSSLLLQTGSADRTDVIRF